MELDPIIAGVLGIGATAVVMLVLGPVLLSIGGSLAELLAYRTELTRSMGVQEEEPVRWRTELLAPRDRRAREWRPAAMPASAPRHRAPSPRP